MSKLLLTIFILLFITIVIFLSIPIIFYNQNDIGTDNIFLQDSQKRTFCSTTKLTCNNDSDCNSKCVQDLEYKCQNIDEANMNNKKVTKSGQKYCLPASTEVKCNLKHGGVPVWTGWGDTNRMEWDCMCMFPDYFGGNGCTQTPGVCELGGKSFMKDRDYSQGEAPGISDCVLPDELKNQGYSIYEREDGTPIIIQSGRANFYKYKLVK